MMWKLKAELRGCFQSGVPFLNFQIKVGSYLDLNVTVISITSHIKRFL